MTCVADNDFFLSETWTNYMGRSAKKIDPLVNSPRNVWNDNGQIMGTFFPETHVILLIGGSKVHVDSSNQVIFPDGNVKLIDKSSYILKPVAPKKGEQ